jgi:UDP-N-acetylglucosamine/UDP-N-acetylgalactosamine diphosphorylase
MRPASFKGGKLTSSCSDQPRVDELRRHYASRGQDHVFRFWEDLDQPAQRRLACQLSSLDLGAVERALAPGAAPKPPSPLAPAPVERLPSLGGDAAAWARAEATGEALLAAGRVAVLVVAGGQASRLGFAGPKGAFPLGPVSGRSLFELQAQKIRYLRSRYGIRLPWYLMTSEATDAATRTLFAENDRFGLPPEDVVFFQQRSLPAVDFDGRLILDRPDHVFVSPDGHGGVLPALARSGALDDIEARGCSALFAYQVDNPLVRIAEPVYLGLHTETAAEVSCKVVAKRDPLEKVGHVVRAEGRIGIVEYTEIEATQRDARDASGNLLLWAGGISIYVFDTGFLRRVAPQADEALPLHRSAKKIPALDAGGRLRTPAEPNGWKLERFVFDLLPRARRVSVVETDRSEYSPLKNADGGESPATARRDLSAQYRAWLEQAGVTLPDDIQLIEVDESLFCGPEDFRARGITRLAQAGNAIRIENGAST